MWTDDVKYWHEVLSISIDPLLTRYFLSLDTQRVVIRCNYYVKQLPILIRTRFLSLQVKWSETTSITELIIGGCYLIFAQLGIMIIISNLKVDSWFRTYYTVPLCSNMFSQCFQHFVLNRYIKYIKCIKYIKILIHV